jgi:ankyrin repeat protein
MLALIAGLLVFPIYDEAYWKHDCHYAADPRVSRLIESIMELDLARARRLLDRGAMDLNGLDAWGTTPLAHAIAAHGQPEGDRLVRLLIDHGADVNRADKYGHTPLMCAMSVGDEDLIELLLRAGGDVHASRPDGTTVLHVAAHTEVSPAIARILLAAGADPAARDSEGKSPGDYAREAGVTELAQLLDAPLTESEPQDTLVTR